MKSFSLPTLLLQVLDHVPRLHQPRPRGTNPLFDPHQPLRRMSPIPFTLIPIPNILDATQILFLLYPRPCLLLCGNPRLLESHIFVLEVDRVSSSGFSRSFSAEIGEVEG